MSELDPTPELPDETPLDRIRFSTRIKKVFSAEGIETIGQVRETSEATLLSFPNLGPGSVAHLRETLGLPLGQKTGTRPAGRRWTSDELHQLAKMLYEGSTAPQIARKLNRTTQAVYARVQRINRKGTTEKSPLRQREWGLKKK